MISLYLHYRALQVSVVCQLSFSVLCVCLGWHIQSHRMSWRSSRDLLAQDPVSGSVPSHLKVAVMATWAAFLPRKRGDTTKADHFLLCHQALWCLRQMMGSLPFPAKANSLSAALAPLSSARRRDKSQTCLLTAVSSVFPSSPSLITLRTDLAKGQAINGSCPAEAQ